MATKAQLEALKNSLLASQQPIIASMHREAFQALINELYNAQSRADILAGVQIDGTTGTGDTLVLIRSGQAYLVPTSLFTEAEGDFVTRNTEQEITAKKIFNADLIVGDPDLDYLEWDNTSNTFAIFSESQLLHKFRGGAAGSLSMGQFDVEGNASINNTSNAGLILGTNNTARIEIEADGDVLLKKVDNEAGDFVRINASTGKLTKRTVAQVQAEIGSLIGFKAVGVRTQTGFFDPNISGTTPIGIFQTPFSWISSYFSIGTVIEIELVGTFSQNFSNFFINLRIGADNYSDIEILANTGLDDLFRANYKITLSSSNEIKIAANVNTPGGLSLTYFEAATQNLNNDFDIDIRGRFSESNSLNNVKSNLITVKVY